MKVYITFIICMLLFAVYFPSLAFADSEHSGHSEHNKAQTQQMFPEPLKTSNPAPDFTLVNQDNKKIGLKDFKGKVVLMNFIYASCGETCPALITKFKDVQKAMKDKLGKEIVLASLTIDPERDSPKVLKAYAKKHEADPKAWQFLTGDPKEVDKVLKDYGILYRKDEKGNIGHVNLVILIDKQGVIAYNFGGVSYPSKQIIDKVAELLAQK